MIITSGNKPFLEICSTIDDDEEAEAVIKRKIRERDGNRCQDCGMTKEQHVAEFQQDLEIHRLVPGIVYQCDTCVLLCRKCHASKPRRTEDAFWATDIVWAGFNLYDQDEKDAIFKLIRLSKDLGKDVDALLREALLRFANECGRELATLSACL
jgi:NAD-dependent dihydropyrimidine dehydrogenase PreA subunit